MPKKKIIIRRRIPTKTENPVSHLESCLKKEEAHSSSDDVKEKSIKRGFKGFKFSDSQCRKQFWFRYR